MDTLTEEERTLVETSRDDMACGKRRVARAAMLMWLLCVGLGLILLPDLYDAVFGALSWSKFGKTAGFLGVLLMLFVSQRQFDRYKSISQSALVKLSRAATC